MSKEMYFAVDVETDGPIPGPMHYSMISFGISCRSIREDDRRTLLDVDDPSHQFYVEMKPISPNFVPEALAVSGLDRDYLLEYGIDPAVAMTSAVTWINDLAARYSAKPIFEAYPLGFDWMFWYWYAVAYSEQGSPFGHSSHRDLKTVYSEKSGQMIRNSVKSRMPRSLRSKRKHTHHGLDDAIEQGELAWNIDQWDGKR